MIVPPLFCLHETSPAVLHAGLGPLAQEGHAAVEVGPKQGHKDKVSMWATSQAQVPPVCQAHHTA